MKTPLVLLLCSVSLLAAVDYAAEGKLWWAHIEFLANDDMRGRDTGSPEFRKATGYVAGCGTWSATGCPRCRPGPWSWSGLCRRRPMRRTTNSVPISLVVWNGSLP